MPGGWEAQRVRFSLGSALLIVLVLASTQIVRNVVDAAHQPMGWGLAAASAALVLDAVVQLYGRFVRRGIAVLLTMVTVLLMVGVLAAGVIPEVRRESDRLAEILPEAARGLEEHDRFGEVARDMSVGDRVQDAVDDFDRRVSAQAALEGAVGTAPAYFLTGILTAFFLLWGGRFSSAFERQIADGTRREQLRAIGQRALAKGHTYVLLALAQGFVLGGLVGLVAGWIGLPAPIALGMSAGLLSLVPFLGVLFGSVPLLLVAAASEPVGTTLALLAFVIALQGASAVFNRLVVHPRSLRVGPAPIVIGVLLAFEVYGLGGVAVALVLVVFGVAALDSLPESDPAPAKADPEQAGP